VENDQRSRKDPPEYETEWSMAFLIEWPPISPLSMTMKNCSLYRLFRKSKPGQALNTSEFVQAFEFKLYRRDSAPNLAAASAAI